MRPGRTSLAAVAALALLVPAGLADRGQTSYESFPWKARQSYEQGLRLQQAGRYEEALAAHEKAIGFGLRRFSGVHIARARCQMQLGENRRAIELFTQFLRDFPLETSCHNCVRRAHAGRAAAYEARGDHASALTDHTVVVRLLAGEVNALRRQKQPVSPETLRELAAAYRARARCLRRLGGRDDEKVEDAREEERRANQLEDEAKPCSEVHGLDTKRPKHNSPGVGRITCCSWGLSEGRTTELAVGQRLNVTIR